MLKERVDPPDPLGMERISLCMIVRDEEARLARCLESVEGVVDELCVLDTGSTDGTVELAEAAGARVERFEWCDDFAAARNASLSMASGDWILVLDADEALADPAGARQRLADFAERHPAAAGQVTIVDRQEQGDLRCRVSRFFPRSAEVRYEGRFHEQPTFAGSPAPTGHTGLEVLHTGYTCDAIAGRDKVARNLRFLESMLADEPDDPYLWYQLGRTQLVAEDFEAALEAFTRALDDVPTDAPYLALLVELTCHTLRRLDRSLEGLTLLQQVSRAFPDRPDTCYLEGLLALDVGQLELAEARFQRCLTLADADGLGGASAEAPRSWGAEYHLGVMRECLGLVEEARECYERALEAKPDHAESRAGLERLATASQSIR